MKKTLTIVSLLVVALAFVPAVQAAPMITYTIEYAADNTFSVYMEASSGDNAGIASFTVPFGDAVLTVSNEAPAAGWYDGVGFVNAGFSAPLRSTGGKTVYASQDTLTDGAPIMYGVGQQPVDFTVGANYEPDAVGTLLTSTNPVSGPAVLIASGEYDPVAFTDINDWTQWLDMQSPDFGGGVFTGEMNQSTGAPVVNTDDLDIMVNVVPEPMTMSLLAIGGLGALIRRKRR